MAKTKWKGFSKIKTPVYSIFTPQTGNVFDIRSLNVGEIVSIRQSLQFKNRHTAEFINSILWQIIVKKPDHIKTYDDFLKKITTKDREALITGVYQFSYGDDKDFTVTCGNADCQSRQPLKIKLSDIFQMNYYPNEQVANSYRLSQEASGQSFMDTNDVKPITKKDIDVVQYDEIQAPPEGMPEDLARIQFPEYFENLEKEKNESIEKQNEDVNAILEEGGLPCILSFTEKVVLPSGLIIYLKQPTLIDEVKLLKLIPLTIKDDELSIALDSINIEKIEEVDPDTGEVLQIINDKLDIIEAYKVLSILDHEKILEVQLDKFDKYGVNLSTMWACSSCGKDNILRIDPVYHFFRIFQ